MVRAVITAAVLIINLILQSTLLQFIRIRGIMPNTAIIIIVSYALLRGQYSGAIVGFFAGLLQDIFFGQSIGYYALLGMITGFLVGKGSGGFYRENYLLPLMLCAITSFIYGLVVYITGFMFSKNFDVLYFLANVIVPEAVYTAIGTLFLYRVLYGVNNFIEEKERYKRRLF